MEGYSEANKAKHEAAYQEHLKNAKAAAKIRGEDIEQAVANPDVSVAIFDLQQVFPCPKSEVSLMFFYNKLSCLHFTVYDAARHEGHWYFWNESVAKKGSNKIGSLLLDYIRFFIEERGVKKFSF